MERSFNPWKKELTKDAPQHETKRGELPNGTSGSTGPVGLAAGLLLGWCPGSPSAGWLDPGSPWLGRAGSVADGGGFCVRVARGRVRTRGWPGIVAWTGEWPDQASTASQAAARSGRRWWLWWREISFEASCSSSLGLRPARDVLAGERRRRATRGGCGQISKVMAARGLEVGGGWN
ncbi:hypothetical protein Droror1_Dr00004346 [Drosera rotundifolia]